MPRVIITIHRYAGDAIISKQKMHLEEAELSLFGDSMITYAGGRQPFPVKVRMASILGFVGCRLCHHHSLCRSCVKGAAGDT